MASGFITLPNGEDWFARWSFYDKVLICILNELSTEGKQGELRQWIKYILPNEENGDVESGYCFYKKIGESKTDFETILRIIDIRFMKEEYQTIFWNTVEKISLNLNKESIIYSHIIKLYKSYIDSLDDKYIDPIDDDLKEIFMLNGFEIA